MPISSESEQLENVSPLQPQPKLASTKPAPGLLLARLGQGVMELYRDALKGSGLRPAHVATLTLLRDRPVGQQTLGELTGLDPVKLVGILNDLETAGLIERRRDCVDRRRHNVAITCAGQAALAGVERATAQVDERLFAGLSPDQREQLAALLQLVEETNPMTDACMQESGGPAGDTGRGAA
jgi:DNA-binding MarR family transcriptional regulator